jgi:hypothetical protein
MYSAREYFCERANFQDRDEMTKADTNSFVTAGLKCDFHWATIALATEILLEVAYSYLFRSTARLPGIDSR